MTYWPRRSPGGIGAAGIELDPIDAALDVLAHRRARIVLRVHPRAHQRIRGRGCGGCATPGNGAARYLEPRTIDAALVDGVADVDVGVAVAVRAHVARRGEARVQVGLQVMDRNEGRGLPRHAGLGIVEHVGVGVDQAGQDGGLAEIDHARIRRNPDLRLRADLGDALAREQHDLIGPELAAPAVEQTAGA
jgi:hypothetical protein